ncbi:MAG: hypothetical protein OQL28_11635 [Sedimenticola sp.]|nr:hypothetical protein [Sedimenticola sp.]
MAMATPPLTIHLLVPGLLGPMPALAGSGQPDRFPLLERLMARARPRAWPGEHLDSVLFSLFGVTADDQLNLPTAAYRRIGDGAEADGRYWLQLTPVYLRPDQDRLLLFDVEDLGLERQEAQTLVELFNRHFADEGWQVEALHPHRWYLPLETPPDLHTYEVTDAFGRNMDLFLPRGEDGIRWHGVLNEIQMLFYQSEVNERREQEGKGPVSGAWLSGGGRVLAEISSPAGALYGDSPLLKGLARATATPRAALPERAEALLQEEGELLVCYEALQRSVLCADPEAWLSRLGRFESWLQPLQQALTENCLRLILYPCNGSALQLDRRALRRFWKRSRPHLQCLESN